jgi:hypothetical protein
MHPEERKRNPLISRHELNKPIVVGVATMNGREQALDLMLASIRNQTMRPDKVFVYHNGRNKDLADNGKFYGLSQLKEPCIYLSMDDDLMYCSTYIEQLVNEVLRHKTIVTHHGRKLRGKGKDYYRDHLAYQCTKINEIETIIDVAGTGVTAFDTSYFNPVGIINDARLRMSDLLFSLEAKKQGKVIQLCTHGRNFVSQLPFDEETSCFGVHKNDCSTQNKIADEILEFY